MTTKYKGFEVGFFKKFDGGKNDLEGEMAKETVVKFGLTSDAAVSTEYKGTRVVFFGKFDEGRNNLEGEMIEEAVVKLSTLSLMVNFNTCSSYTGTIQYTDIETGLTISKIDNYSVNMLF